jgi:predicted RNase H-like HicB family nuclease
MKRLYNAVFAGVGTDQIDVAFPDFPGCVTVASTLEAAYEGAADALLFHIESMVEDGDAIPPGGDDAALLEMVREYESEGHQVLAASIAVDLPTGRAKRINITLPEYVLDAVDRWAKAHGETRSGVLAHASMDYIAKRK